MKCLVYVLFATERVSNTERSGMGHKQSYNQRPQGTGMHLVYTCITLIS